MNDPGYKEAYRATRMLTQEKTSKRNSALPEGQLLLKIITKNIYISFLTDTSQFLKIQLIWFCLAMRAVTFAVLFPRSSYLSHKSDYTANFTVFQFKYNLHNQFTMDVRAKV